MILVKKKSYKRDTEVIQEVLLICIKFVGNRSIFIIPNLYWYHS